MIVCCLYASKRVPTRCEHASMLILTGVQASLT